MVTGLAAMTAAELEPATRRYLERAFKAGQAVRGVGRTVQTLFDKPRRGR